MIECVFCDNAATKRDKDMDMWLCTPHWNEMNGTDFVGVIPELEEVW